MKLLIGYDGSSCSDAAIDDLQRAGLGDDVEALLLTAADSWPLASAAMLPGTAIDPAIGGLGMLDGAQLDVLANRSVEDAKAIASRGADKLRSLFPAWKISSETSTDSAANALLSRADSLKPDLIVVGSHGHSAAGRFFLGSTSQSVLHHARCTVRVARKGREESEANSGLRLMIGIDGSQDSLAAARWLSRRRWPRGTEVRVVGATDLTAVALAAGADPSMSTAVVNALHGARLRLQREVHHEVKSLGESGLVATPALRDGSAKRILVDEAETWAADCIFVGARGMGGLTRLLIGSVSSSVAARAHCSVEVVRTIPT